MLGEISMGKVIPTILRKLADTFGKKEIINDANNLVMVEARGGFVRVICHTDRQMVQVVDRFAGRGNCVLDGFERWDEEENEKFILTFKVMDEFDPSVIYN